MFPSDAQWPGIGEACWPARDRIVSEAMMGGGTFILLKAGRPWPESAKQTEIRLAILLKMLQIAHFGTGWAKRTPGGCINCHLCGIWLIQRELFALLPSSAGIVRFVTQFTVLTRQLAQYHASESGEKEYSSIC